jgi:hypothetical protein
MEQFIKKEHTFISFAMIWDLSFHRELELHCVSFTTNEYRLPVNHFININQFSKHRVSERKSQTNNQRRVPVSVKQMVFPMSEKDHRFHKLFGSIFSMGL